MLAGAEETDSADELVRKRTREVARMVRCRWMWLFGLFGRGRES